MIKKFSILLGLLLALGASAAWAQTTPSITFGANVTTGNGSVTPVLTWSTTPVATSCTASGDWTGTKAASGSETLAVITKSATYNITCQWPGQSTITVRWIPPTKNTDGSTLTDLAGFTVYYGTSPTMSSNTVLDVPGAGVTSKVLSPLTPATYYIVMDAYNAAGVHSDKSAIFSKVLASSSSTSKTVGIVVNPVPNGVTGITLE